MKLSEYIRREQEQLRALPTIQVRLDRLVAEVMKENVESGGRKYPTVDSMYEETIRRAEAEEASEATNKS